MQLARYVLIFQLASYMAVSIILYSYVSGYKYSNIVATGINFLDDLTTKHCYFM